jgi:hypothetical protein
LRTRHCNGAIHWRAHGDPADRKDGGPIKRAAAYAFSRGRVAGSTSHPTWRK